MQNLMLMKPSNLMVVLASVVLAACARDRVNNPVDNVREAAQEPSLQGKVYKSECSSKPVSAVLTKILSGNSLKAAQTHYKFVGANVTRTTQLYPTAECSGEVALTFEEWGEFNVNRNQKNAEGAGALDIDYRSLKVKVNNDMSKDVANDIELCDAKDWTAGQVRDVTTVAQNVNCYNFEVPRQERTVYMVEGKVLFLGSDEKDTSGRSEKLDRSEAFKE